MRPASAGSFQAERCIELHNAIVKAGLDRLPPERRARISMRRSWFTVHSISPAQVNLPNDIVEFLSRIDIIEPSSQLSFLPHLRGVAAPSELRHNQDDLYHGRHNDCVILYRSHGPDGLGLVLDLHDRLACYLDDYHDEPGAQRLWVPLYDALERYRRCILYGKFVIRPQAFSGRGLEPQGWRFESWTNADLERTLQTWRDLVQVITRRMRGVRKDAQITTGLVDRSTLDQYPSIPPFAREFLLRAVKPAFEFIAPQLRVPDASFINSIGPQLQQRRQTSNEQDDASATATFLLFPWAQRGIEFASAVEQQSWQSELLDNRAGLYLTSTSLFADTATLLLPYTIGSDGHALAADGSHVEGSSNTSLYTHGHCPFLPDHRPQLASVLVQWWEKLENDEWMVGKTGVEESGDIWKEADTEEGADAYKLAFVCF